MTKEEIVQNIKIRISTIESYRPEEYTLNEGILFELKDLLSMIEKEQPSLPSNLDEAARKYGHEEPILPEGYNDGDIPLYERWTADAFKAGAEWMARQGYTVNGIVICDKELTGGYKDIVMSIPDELKVDDKVTIQIRKR